MSNEIAQTNQQQLLALKHSLYPDASFESIALVLEYCKAAGVDVMSKSVHIVPMGGKDVIIPGIGLYRIKASRSGEYLGTDAPVFGPDVTETLGQMTVTYPAWCEVTVKRLVAGQVATFTARELWKENYGSTRDGTPNSIWGKRPYGQLSKTAESQALRKAFPELVSHQMVYEEAHNAPAAFQEADGERLSDAQIAVQNAANKLKQDKQIDSPYVQGPILNKVRQICVTHEIKSDVIQTWLDKAGVKRLDQLTDQQLQAIVNKFEGNQNV